MGLDSLGDWACESENRSTFWSGLAEVGSGMIFRPKSLYTSYRINMNKLYRAPKPTLAKGLGLSRAWCNPRKHLNTKTSRVMCSPREGSST